VQYTHGMVSCCEYTGVPLITLLEMAGADLNKGKFILAEGADGSAMTRTIPIELVKSGEVLVAWGQNGEMLRPENGYPLRLVVPGVQGVSWVKYLRRVELGDMPWATKDEAVHYIDLMPDGQHRQYTSIQECKSVISTPSGGQALLATGFYNITGLAWSGRGKVKRVDVSVDGGRNWRTARLETPSSASASHASTSTGCGTARAPSCKAAPWTKRVTCSPPTSSCARCAARAPSITTTRCNRGWCRKTAR